MFKVQHLTWDGDYEAEYPNLQDAEIEALEMSITDMPYGVWDGDELLSIAYQGEIFKK